MKRMSRRRFFHLRSPVPIPDRTLLLMQAALGERRRHRPDDNG
jgi:hypothetical protein